MRSSSRRSSDDQLPPVLGNRVQLQQVILNLVMNAIDAMRSVQARVLSVKTTLNGRDGVHVSIADTGIGIDPSNLDQIFKPLFTTKEHGMGMGLSICRSIVESHNGRIWVSADQERGSIFHLVLPTERARNLIMHSKVEQIVYVVDDDADVREGVCALLQSVGLEGCGAELNGGVSGPQAFGGAELSGIGCQIAGLERARFSSRAGQGAETTFRSSSLPGTATSR